VKSYLLSHVSPSIVLRDAVALATNRRTTNADLIAHIGEIGARKLYVPLAYDSLLAYCRSELGLTRDEALKRICVARVARRWLGSSSVSPTIEWFRNHFLLLHRGWSRSPRTHSTSSTR